MSCQQWWCMLVTVTSMFTAKQVTDRFPFPLELDMSPYTEQGGRGQYELSAVVVHVGGCGGGHYTACIRDVDDLGNWENPVGGCL